MHELRSHTYFAKEAGCVLVYMECTPLADAAAAAGRVVACIEHVNGWMGSNRLKMNPDKTQLIWIGTRQQLAKIDISSLTLLSAAVPLSSTVTDLGVRIDSHAVDHPLESERPNLWSG